MPGLGHKLALWLAVGVLAVSLAAMATAMRAAALPPEASGKMLVVFQPGTHEDDILRHLIKAGAIGKVVQTLGTGPHRMNPKSRPAWFFDKKAY